MNVEEVALPKVWCCYCGGAVGLSSLLVRDLEETEDEHVERRRIALKLIADGAALECGRCR
jgi:hypothetical protein